MQIAAGLAFLHYHQIIHRNLKPTNIAFTSDSATTKLLDFGKFATLRENELAKLDTLELNKHEEKEGQRSQGRGSKLYVAAFMAPEQVISDGRLTLYPTAKGAARVDSYSYSMILYALTTGLRPYADFMMASTAAATGGATNSGATSMFTILERILDGQRPTLPSAYPPPLRNLLERCWCKRPSERLSMTAIMQEIQTPAVAKALDDIWVP